MLVYCDALQCLHCIVSSVNFMINDDLGSVSFVWMWCFQEKSTEENSAELNGIIVNEPDKCLHFSPPCRTGCGGFFLFLYIHIRMKWRCFVGLLLWINFTFSSYSLCHIKETHTEEGIQQNGWQTCPWVLQSVWTSHVGIILIPWWCLFKKLPSLGWMLIHNLQ